MTPRKILELYVFTLFLLTIDWVLCVFFTRDGIPSWVYLLINFPFGIVYLWTEAQWTGGSFTVLGRSVNETIIGTLQIAAIYTQSLEYFVIWQRWFKKSRSGQLIEQNSDVNKISHFNSSPSLPGAISPWAMILGLSVLTLVLSCGGLFLYFASTGQYYQKQLSLGQQLSVPLFVGITLALLWLIMGFTAALINSIFLSTRKFDR